MLPLNLLKNLKLKILKKYKYIFFIEQFFSAKLLFLKIQNKLQVNYTPGYAIRDNLSLVTEHG